MSRHRAHPDDLNTLDIQFCYEYRTCNRNALKTYKKIHPEVTDETAGVNGHKILKKTKVQELIKKLDDEALGGMKITGDNTTREMANLGYLKIVKNPMKPTKAELKIVASVGHVKVGALDKLAKVQKIYNPDVLPNPDGDDDATGPTIYLPSNTRFRVG